MTEMEFDMAATLTIRIDEALKADAEEFFDEIGMNMTTAVTCFFKKCLAVGEIPFKLGKMSKHARLLAALHEAEEVANDPNAPTCTDPDKLEEFLLMKYGVRKTSRYKKSLKKMLKRGKDIKKLTNVVLKLANGEQLPPQYKDHPLSGDLAGLRDCHIENDWVLLYEIKDNLLILSLADTGTHSDLGL